MIATRLLFDPPHANDGENPIIAPLSEVGMHTSASLEKSMKNPSIILAVTLAALLSACGKQESAPPEASAPIVPEAAAPAAAPVAEPAVAENTRGKSVFNNTCSMCHAVGAAGAPKPGDKADWGPRIAQGKDMLYKHALEGFTGAKGVMPARGGAAALSDDDVKAAVDHMVALSQ
jgi:cytochrome c5